MDTMMSGMAVKLSGNVHQDFSAMMIPHHQSTIDMAIAEFRYGIIAAPPDRAGDHC